MFLLELMQNLPGDQVGERSQERLKARVNLGADLMLIMPVPAEVDNGIHARNRRAGKRDIRRDVGRPHRSRRGSKDATSSSAAHRGLGAKP
jgi:hypothetical protein